MQSGVLLDALLSNVRNLPFNLEFAVTNKCNLRCVQCNVWRYYNENPEKSREELTVEEIENIFSSYNGFSMIGITGGEPFLREDLPEIVSVISRTQRKLRMLFITTNGQLPETTERKLREILENRDANGRRFRLVQLVSLDGPRNLHNYIRSNEKAYDRVINTIKLLSELRSVYDIFDLGTVTVCSPFNIDKFDEVISEIAKLKNEYDLEPSFCVWFKGRLYKNIKSQEDVEKFRRKLIDLIPEIKGVVKKRKSLLSTGRCVFYDLLNSWLENPTKQVVPCGAAKVRYLLDTYGNVYPCTIFNAAIGNLRHYNYSLIELLSSNRRRKVRLLVEREGCPICCNTCETIPAMMAYPLHTLIKWINSSALGFNRPHDSRKECKTQRCFL